MWWGWLFPPLRILSLFLVVCSLAFWARNGILLILDWFLLFGLVFVVNLSTRRCLIILSWRTLWLLPGICCFNCLKIVFIFIIKEPFSQNSEVLGCVITVILLLFFHLGIKTLIIPSVWERGGSFYGQSYVSSWSSVSTPLLCSASTLHHTQLDTGLVKYVLVKLVESLPGEMLAMQTSLPAVLKPHLAFLSD